MLTRNAWLEKTKMADVWRKAIRTSIDIFRGQSTLLQRVFVQLSGIRSVSQNHLPVHYRYRDQLKYGIYAARPGLVKENALESARLAIIRKAKTKQVNMIKAHIPITKKPLGTRMGKGKGKVDHHVANVKAGKLLFEYSCDSETLAEEAYRQASNRLPVKTHLRVKPEGKKQIWTQF